MSSERELITRGKMKNTHTTTQSSVKFVSLGVKSWQVSSGAITKTAIITTMSGENQRYRTASTGRLVSHNYDNCCCSTLFTNTTINIHILYYYGDSTYLKSSFCIRTPNVCLWGTKSRCITTHLYTATTPPPLCWPTPHTLCLLYCLLLLLQGVPPE